ncbi:hypothetical protein [Geodermatophilus poikilotrophus]|nr:hypothetical protein [Geodermatophilus poikilotrophus]
MTGTPGPSSRQATRTGYDVPRSAAGTPAEPVSPLPHLGTWTATS